MSDNGTEIEAAARRLLGTPNAKLSTQDELRFGTHGSISVMIAGPKAGTWYDHEHKAGGGVPDLLARYGERDDPAPPHRQNVIRYAYPGEDGEVVFWVCRIGHGNNKRIWQEQPGPGKDGIKRDPKTGKPTMQGARLVPYRLPEIIAARKNRNGHAPRVYITEGEKDADRLAGWALVATTNPGGAGKWRDEYSQHLAGCDVVVIPDNDDTGRSHADQVARSVAPHAESVKLVTLHGLAEKGDISDWIDGGGTQAVLEDIIDATAVYDGHATPPKGSSPDNDDDSIICERLKPANRILSGADFVASFTPPDWLIEGIIQRGRLYACTSRTGHGKTAVWLHNACMIQSGRKVGPLDAEPGNVLILAGENPEDLKARMIGMARAFNLKQLPYVLPGSFPMTEDEAEALRWDIAALRVPFNLIIGDTAASYFPGDDDNNNVQAGQYGRTLRTFTACNGNPALVALSHPTKNASRDNLLLRGGGAFLNEIDGNLTLWSDQLGEMTVLHWQAKIRGPDFDPLNYILKSFGTGHKDTKGGEVFTIIAQPIDEIEASFKAAEKTDDEDAVLRTLDKNPKWSMANIARYLGWSTKTGEPAKTRVFRALERLKGDNLVRNFRRGWSVTPAGKSALDEAEK